MKIAVVAGGLSPERDVSLSSGSLIANALKLKGHKTVLIDVYEGISANDNDFDNLYEDDINKPYSYVIPDIEPNLSEIKKKSNNGDSLIGSNVIEVCKLADVVYIALHGAMGENGQLQAIFDVMGIKYTGTGYIGSLLAMDKDLTKKLIRQENIPTADWMIVSELVSVSNVYDKIGLPCVVKPCSAGSSIGVSIVHCLDELNNAINNAKKIEQSILIEKMVAGREFSVGILDGIPLPVIEIIPKTSFYDYSNKYQAGLTEEICPANLSEVDTKRVQILALKVFDILRLKSYARIDFILNNNGEFICLEANTLPGMTPTSLLPQEALAFGISYVDLCNYIVDLAVK